MGYTNSPLVSYTKLSPNNSGTRTHSIDRITPHCIVGQLSVESAGEWFSHASTQASCNYVIGSDARVGLIVPESQRSWCSSSRENDQRAVTIECASDRTDPYAFKDVVFEKLIELCVDICRRNSKTKLLWLGDKQTTLNYTPAADEMVLTVHRWFANKACPGAWLMARMAYLATRVTAAISQRNGENDPKTASSEGNNARTSTQAMQVNAIGSEESRAKFLLDLVHDTDKSGILPSVTTAQMILESGYCSTDLALEANNCFGMKKTLSGNAWAESTWDGKSAYTKTTAEQDAKGRVYYIKAAFRKYPCIEDSIRDHSAYLLGAMRGTAKRYAGLVDATHYSEAIHIIKAGGYATDVRYESKLTSIIQRYGLDRYDSQTEKTSQVEKSTPNIMYIVQAGAYSYESGAKTMLAKVKKYVKDAFIKKEGGMYKVQCGAFSGRANAEKLGQQLKDAGISTYIKEA